VIKCGIVHLLPVLAGIKTEKYSYSSQNALIRGDKLYMKNMSQMSLYKEKKEYGIFFGNWKLKY